MNQGKLEVVKEEMARVNINILGISELKCTGMGKFNSDEHYIYYCGQEFLRRNGVAIIANQSPKCSTWMQSQKRQDDLCSFPRQIIQNHGNPCQCPISYAEEISYLSNEISRCWGDRVGYSTFNDLDPRSASCVLFAYSSLDLPLSITSLPRPLPSTSSDLRGFLGLSGSTSAVSEAATGGGQSFPPWSCLFCLAQWFLFARRTL